MTHFLVYHSENTRGPTKGYKPGAETKRHLGITGKTKRERVWVVVGSATAKKSERVKFTLWKTFIVTKIHTKPSDKFPNKYAGKKSKPIRKCLNGLQWFENFKKKVLSPARYASQKLTDPTVIRGLKRIAHV